MVGYNARLPARICREDCGELTAPAAARLGPATAVGPSLHSCRESEETSFRKWASSKT